MAFYSSESDVNAANQLLVKSADMFISKFEYSGVGVAGVSVDDITLTPAVSPAFTVSGLVSTVGINVVVKAEGGKLFQGSVKSNDAVSVTFDATLMKNVADGVAGVAADWTAANSYDFYVLTPSSVYRFGDFFGHTAEINFNAEEEEAELKRGVPRKLIAKALLERTLSIAGVNYNVPNGDVLKTIMQMDPRGISVGETEYQTGFDPSAKANYRVALLGETYESKPFTILAYKGLFKLGGGLNLSEEGFKSVPYEFGLLSDSIRSSAYDAFSIFIGD